MSIDIWQIVTGLLVPAFGGLTVYVVRLREDFADHKLHVAEKYATNSYIQEVEKRLTDHLIRIETKLDRIQETN